MGVVGTDSKGNRNVKWTPSRDPRMMAPLATAAVDSGLINATGFVVGGGGLLVTALWLKALYR
jgi:hypothetical protein